MFPWQRFLAEHTVLGKEIELQELCSYVSPLQDIKVDSPDSGLRSFPGHLSGPASTSSGLSCWLLRPGYLPICLSSTPESSECTETVQTLGSNVLVQFM